MSLNDGLHAFVDQPGNLGWRPAAMKAQGFSSLVVHALAHENDVPWYAEAVQLRNEARAAGMKVYCWQTLHPGFPPEASAAKALANAPHWDGLVPNLETVLLTPESDDYVAKLLAGLPPDYPLGVSTEPTFPLTGGMQALSGRVGTVLMPQGYVLENGHTPASCRSFAIDRPPLYEKWLYWTDFVYLPGRPLRRVMIESQEGPYDFVVKDGLNRWRVNELSRKVFNRQPPYKWVGMLRGVWLLPKVAPTVRTTPLDPGARWIPAATLLDSFRAARFIGGPLPNRGGIYLAESTQDTAAWRL